MTKTNLRYLKMLVTMIVQYEPIEVTLLILKYNNIKVEHRRQRFIKNISYQVT